MMLCFDDTHMLYTSYAAYLVALSILGTFLAYVISDLDDHKAESVILLSYVCHT